VKANEKYYFLKLWVRAKGRGTEQGGLSESSHLEI